MLRAQYKALEEDKHNLVLELKDRETKVDKLKKKYELLLFRFAPSEDGEEERTQAYYVIRAAQVPFVCASSVCDMRLTYDTGKRGIAARGR